MLLRMSFAFPFTHLELGRGHKESYRDLGKSKLWIRLQQGSPAPRAQTGPGPWPVGSRAAQQELSGRGAREARLWVQPPPSAGVAASAPRRSSGVRF